MRATVAIFVAGGLGALTRYALDGAISRATAGGFPWGTFVINISGSFLLGVIFTLLSERFSVDPWIRSTLTLGFLGAYTTFSTLTLETARLIEDRVYILAAANSLGSLAAGLIAVFAGIALGRAL